VISLDLVQVLVQSGAVGLLLAFGYFGYKLASRLMTFGFALVTNHLAHLEQAFLKMEKTLTHLDESIDRLVRKK
jgi:hypothetical protein